MTQTEYDFTDLTSILKAISDLPDDDKVAYNRDMSKIEKAAKSFFHSRTNSQLMDMADEEVVLGGDRVDIYDYMGSALEWYETEVDCRNWPIDADVAKAARKWDPNWSGEDDYLLDRFSELEKQVRGIQKKLDRIAILLKDAKFTISGETALRL